MTDPVPPGAVERQPTAADRDAAVARLSSAFAHDVIPLEEFEYRTTAALRATSIAELAELLADLPAPAAAGAGGAGRGGALAVPSLRIAAVFGNVERGGPMDVPARLEIRALVGNVELDLSTARFGAGVTEIAISAVLGNVELRLPAGATVENQGRGVLASFTCRAPAPRGAAAGAASTVRILVTGRAVLGNVEIETAPGATGRS